MKSSELIKQKALSLGFSACGIAESGKLEHEDIHLKEYLENNFHGEMGYLAKNFEKRIDTQLLVPGSKSVIVVLLNYFPSKIQSGDNIPFISKYAYGKDYHLVLKEKLKKLFDNLNSDIAPIHGRIFGGSAPVLEKAWAVKAGLGWIGKNGLLINKELGSYFFIGVIISDLETEFDIPYESENCGSCSKCLTDCPTKAFMRPSVLDARKCISYLTIETDGDIPEEYKDKIGNRIYGCDSCQDSCPWNKNIKPHIIDEFNPRNEIFEMNVGEFANLQEDKFNQLFKDSAIQRAGFDKFKRNLFSAFPD